MPDGEEKPTVSVSRTLSVGEKNYSEPDKEGLAVIFGVQYLHQYLYGRMFMIIMDHKALIRLFHEMKVVIPERRSCPMLEQLHHSREWAAWRAWPEVTCGGHIWRLTLSMRQSPALLVKNTDTGLLHPWEWWAVQTFKEKRKEKKQETSGAYERLIITGRGADRILLL